MMAGEKICDSFIGAPIPLGYCAAVSIENALDSDFKYRCFL
jgi:hypothetical protein